MVRRVRGHGALRWSTGGAVAALLTAAVVGSPGSGDAARHRDVALSSIGYVMGPSGIPQPSDSYLDMANGFMAPRGFDDALVSLWTPAWGYKTDTSVGQGTVELVNAVQARLAEAPNEPIWVFGYSQSTAVAALAADRLHAQGVPEQALHFVLIGDSAAPNGGILPRLDLDGSGPTLPLLDLTLGTTTPTDLYPTDVYTIEYDGYADFPQYPVNLLADLNAVLGMFLHHLFYPALTPDQIAGAVPLEVSDDSLANFYMIPSDYLPLLMPLQATPLVGKPLADLLDPALRVLVNTGYGNLEHGWSDGPADVATPISLGVPDIDPAQLSLALGDAVQQGWQDATHNLIADPSSVMLGGLLGGELLGSMLAAGSAAGLL